MKAKRFLIILFIPLILLSSCQKRQSIGYNALCGDFVCEYSYICDGELFRSKISSELTDGGTARWAKISFAEPETLVGINGEFSAGEYKAEIGDTVLRGEAARALFISAEPLLCGKKAEFAGVCVIGGRKAERFVIKTEQGEVSLYVDGTSEEPISLKSLWRGKEIELSIISFERK